MYSPGIASQDTWRCAASSPGGLRSPPTRRRAASTRGARVHAGMAYVFLEHRSSLEHITASRPASSAMSVNPEQPTRILAIERELRRPRLVRLRAHAGPTR